MEPPTRRGLADHVYHQVKLQLFDSRFGRDGWISIDALATELQVSRQPVIAAMKRLAHEGFVSIVPQVGCRVRTYTAEEIADFYQLFAFGEALVAELAAKRATSSDLARLKAIAAMIGDVGKQRASKKDLARQYRALNRELHSEIRRIARSTSVTELVESMGDRSDFFIAASGRPMFAETLRKANTEHWEVVEAIARADPSAAYQAMLNHIQQTSIRLSAFLEEAAIGVPATTSRSLGIAVRNN